METNNKQKRKINLIDLAVVLVLIGVVLFGASYLLGDNDKQQVKDTVRFSFESSGVDAEVISYVKEGQLVIDGKTKSKLGTVVAVHEAPARIIVEDHNHETIEIREFPNKLDVTLEIEGNASISHPDILLDTFALKVGKHVDCIVGETKVSGYIVDIDHEDSSVKQDMIEEDESK